MSLSEQVRDLKLQIDTLRSTSESKDRQIGTLSEQINLTDIKNTDNILELTAQNGSAMARAEEFKTRAEVMQTREQRFERESVELRNEISNSNAKTNVIVSELREAQASHDKVSA